MLNANAEQLRLRLTLIVLPALLPEIRLLVLFAKAESDFYALLVLRMT